MRGSEEAKCASGLTIREGMDMHTESVRKAVDSSN